LGLRHSKPHDTGACSLINGFNKTHSNAHLPGIIFGKQEIHSLVDKEPLSLEVMVKGLTKEVKELCSTIAGLDKHVVTTKQKVSLKCTSSSTNKADKKAKTGGASGSPGKDSGSGGKGKQSRGGTAQHKAGAAKTDWFDQGGW
jgi:hypothetical protein